MNNGCGLLQIVVTLILMCTLAQTGMSADISHVKNEEILMRKIGHEVLLAHGDSISRVLPVESNYEGYRLRFENEFQFNPSILIRAIDDVMSQSNLAKGYIVEMKRCDDDTTLYGYEVVGALDLTKIPCINRNQIMACYTLGITFQKEGRETLLSFLQLPFGLFFALFLLLLIGLGWSLFAGKNDGNRSMSHVIGIGDYQFDHDNMLLTTSESEILLTGKESALLKLLTTSKNVTVKREEILLKVWGDKGDYIGRTLDVFISRLRKKLDKDPRVKISNIRGIGYRLAVKD